MSYFVPQVNVKIRQDFVSNLIQLKLDSKPVELNPINEMQSS